MSSFRRTNTNNAGDSVLYGANDFHVFVDLVNGTTSGIPPVKLKSTSNVELWDGVLKFRNPADTFSMTIKTPAITANRELNLPNISSNDTIATLAAIQTWTNKTFNVSNNTLTSNSALLGDILYHDGTSYTKLSGNTIANKRYLRQTGTGSASAAPAWDAINSFSADLIISGDISPTQITADQNNYNPTDLSTSTILRLSSDASRNITGLQGGEDGRIIMIHNVGSNDIVLKNEDALSTDINRFLFGSDITLNANKSASLWYDTVSDRWRLFGFNIVPAGSGAPTSAQYLTLATDAALASERVATAGTNIKFVDGGAGGALTISTGTENFALTGDISPTQITANQNDYSPTGLSTATILRLTSDASRNVTGLAGGADGRLISIHNVGSFNIVLTNDDVASVTPGNRFLLGSNITLTPNTSVTLWYDSTTSRWRLLSSTISSGFSAGNITADLYVSGDISPTQITASQNNYNPPNLATSSVLRLSSDASRNITGLDGDVDGRIIIIHNVGANNIVLTNQDTLSLAQHRFLFGSNVTIGANRAIALRYDAVDSRWRNITTLETHSNVGTGAGQVYKQTTGMLSEFKTILAGTGITVTNNTNDVTISTATAPTDTYKPTFGGRKTGRYIPTMDDTYADGILANHFTVAEVSGSQLMNTSGFNYSARDFQCSSTDVSVGIRGTDNVFSLRQNPYLEIWYQIETASQTELRIMMGLFNITSTVESSSALNNYSGILWFKQSGNSYAEWARNDGDSSQDNSGAILSPHDTAVHRIRINGVASTPKWQVSLDGASYTDYLTEIPALDTALNVCVSGSRNNSTLTNFRIIAIYMEIDAGASPF